MYNRVKVNMVEEYDGLRLFQPCAAPRIEEPFEEPHKTPVEHNMDARRASTSESLGTLSFGKGGN